MFFGGLFLAYMLYRVWYPEAWAEGSAQLDIALGGFNTVVLIGSSLTMALAVRAAQTGLRKQTVVWLILTMAARSDLSRRSSISSMQGQVRASSRPGPNFHFRGPHAGSSRDLSSRCTSLMTGLHALHMVIGFGLLSVIAVDGPQGAVLTRVVYAGRDAAASTGTSSTSSGSSCSRSCTWWTGRTTRIARHGRTRFAEEHLLHDLRRADGADRRHRAVAFVNLGPLQLSGRASPSPSPRRRS